jgi:hypothetical protein
VSTALFAISVLILFWSVRVRFGRRDALAKELEKLQRDRDYSEIYGGDAESKDDEKRRESLERGGDRDQRAMFALVCWGSHTISAVLAAIGAALWLNEDQSHTLIDFLKCVAVILMVVWFAWILLSAASRFARFERDIVWLKQVLRGLHSSAVNMRRTSIDEYMELNDRIDNFKNE